MEEAADLEDVDLADLEEAYYRELMESEDFMLVEGGGFYQTFRSCLWPIVSQTADSVLPLLALCLILRVISMTRVPRALVHFVSFLTGVAALIQFCKRGFVYGLFLGVMGYVVLLVAPGYRGRVMAVLTVTSMLACELIFVETTTWNNVRGPLMILIMKQISLAFDVDQGLVPNLPNVLQYSGYAFCAGSVIFGPFTTYQEYNQVLEGKKINVWWIIGVLRSFVVAFCCVVISVCIAPYIFSEGSFKWLIAYQSALSFRFSHYFVSFISECTCMVCGIGTETSVDGQKTTLWRYDVARPFHVEIPRSLVEVVIHWNVAIHVFLKNYVFKKAQALGRFAAVFLTFLASSILHGVNFQLSAVLLSIGTYAYIEHVLRHRLGNVFSACILARRCRPGCTHKYNESNFWVMAVNLAFGFLAVFHLAYLGIMFGDTEAQEKGYGVEHTLNNWSHLGFASHWVALGCFLVYKVLGQRS